MPMQLPRRLTAAVFLLLAAVFVASPRAALAHAVLVNSTPQKNVAVAGPDVVISLRYNSRVDGARSTLSLLKPDGTIENVSGITQPRPDVVAATGHTTAKGAYILRWQVLSSDGHITRGEIPFQVK